MALTTLLALRAFVFVILAVASETIQRGSSKPLQALLVTVGTLDPFRCMGIPQHELGSVVIESTRGSFPITLLVTVCTGLAQCAFVLVILLVAGITIGWRILVHLALVAILAIDFVMLAKQWELGF